MLNIVVRRLLISIPTIIGMTILAFGLIRMVPGDPVDLLLGERGADPEVRQELRARFKLDRPIIEQYFYFLAGAVKGDLGTSIVSRQPVTTEFFSRFPATLELGLTAILFAVILGIPIGVIAANNRGKSLDLGLMSGALVGYSMPIFWWGLVLILFFSVKLGLTPVSGRISAMFDITPVTGFLLIDVWFSEEGFEAFKAALMHLILPALALGTIPLAAIARITRSSLLEVLREDYVRTAKAKGLDHNSVVYGHALRNALIPIITVIGLMMGQILTGAVLTETIFSWPGIGKWIVSSVESRDYPVIQGGILLISLTIIFLNLLVDLTYAVVNPLIRSQKI
jgi:dipeptide transport system permease protein